MDYLIDFDFTIVKGASHFIGKSGVIEMTCAPELTDARIFELMGSEPLQAMIATRLAREHGEKNIFMISIKSIKPRTHDKE